MHLPTRNLRAVLANPYAPETSSFYAPNYVQVYAGSSSWPLKNEQGYTLSSTYRPETSQNRTQKNSSQCNQIAVTTSRTSQVTKSYRRQSTCDHWYQAGNIRCSHKGCMFMGSQKSVEVHRMDRHLIYPPGWEHRKRRDDWDADPSLKGKVVPIQGTNITLDSAEALEEWLVERKKRWPSSSRIDEKKRKLEEALARGQIPFHETSHLGKRNSRDFDAVQARRHIRMNLNVPPRRRVGARDVLNQRAGRKIKSEKTPTSHFRNSQTSRHRDLLSQHVDPVDAMSNPEDEDSPPEIVSSKAPSARTELCKSSEMTDDQVTSPQVCSKDSPENRATKSSMNLRAPQPKGSRNPFASRPSLLRDLLLPEIRITISNLSQAIRFLVDNDFLAGVELKPDEAERTNLIQVIEQAP